MRHLFWCRIFLLQGAEFSATGIGCAAFFWMRHLFWCRIFLLQGAEFSATGILLQGTKLQIPNNNKFQLRSEIRPSCCISGVKWYVTVQLEAASSLGMFVPSVQLPCSRVAGDGRRRKR
jgi:hypothetical protein